MATKAKPIPDGYHTVTPCLTLKNTQQAIEYYKKAFGAKVLELFPGLEGQGVMHASIQIGNSIIMLGDEMPGQGNKSIESLEASPVSLYVYVPDVDETYRQAIDAGASEIMPVDDMFWGDRCGTLKDPFGYTWMIATQKQELTREEIKQGAEAFFAASKRYA